MESRKKESEHRTVAQILRDMSYSELENTIRGMASDMVPTERRVDIVMMLGYHKVLGRYLAEMKRRAVRDARMAVTIAKQRARSLGVRRP